MWDFSRFSEPVACQEYSCDATEWLNNSVLTEDEVTPEEWEIIQSNTGKICKGQKYLKIVGIWEGEWSVFRAIPEINDICCKYDLYCE